MENLKSVKILSSKKQCRKRKICNSALCKTVAENMFFTILHSVNLPIYGWLQKTYFKYFACCRKHDLSFLQPSADLVAENTIL